VPFNAAPTTALSLGPIREEQPRAPAAAPMGPSFFLLDRPTKQPNKHQGEPYVIDLTTNDQRLTTDRSIASCLNSFRDPANPQGPHNPRSIKECGIVAFQP
jgi:hypothetical protein